MEINPGTGRASAVTVNAAFVGGGPAGLAPLVLAARQGTLPQLASKGLVVIEQGQTLGSGSLGEYTIGSDTLTDTFLECLDHGAEPRLIALRDHPASLALAAYRGGAAPLPLVAIFLDALGEALREAILSAGGQVLMGCKALSSQRQSDGLWRTRLRLETGERDLVSRHLVLALGGEQRLDALMPVQVAGTTLLPRFAGKLMLSNEILSRGGAETVRHRLTGIEGPKVVIIGGSHSALAAANFLLSHRHEVGCGPMSITLIHRKKLRVFYASAEAAEAEGYRDFDVNDICPISGRLFRLAGFRLEARTLVMRALEIGGLKPEPRLQILPLHGSFSSTEVRSSIEEAHLVVAALGYRPIKLPLLAEDGTRIALFEDKHSTAPRVDRQCRVLDDDGQPIGGLLALGLAAGFIPDGPLGGEPSFRGQTNGIWLWQNGIGAEIVDSLLTAVRPVGKIKNVAA